MAQPTYPRIGDLLLARGLVSEADLRAVLTEQKKSGRRLGDILVDMGRITPANLVDVLSERLSTGRAIGEMPAESVIPELVYQMIDIGFESGEVERMLGEAARHYEQEIEYDVRRLTDRLQPILLLFLAAGVVFLALAVLLPMWNLISIFR
jgi:type II secretory pathway component PulF